MKLNIITANEKLQLKDQEKLFPIFLMVFSVTNTVFCGKIISSLHVLKHKEEHTSGKST